MRLKKDQNDLYTAFYNSTIAFQAPVKSKNGGLSSPKDRPRNMG